ncbi:MAG: (d)CMP kinase [Planctomycetota bacterium]|jgi:cytidylate kinase|nr:(d)CMP kinase [Planctomycetota bacterium]
MSATGGSEMLEAVAIDGPAGSGKSSVARRIAAVRGYLYVDTGAMYRAVALAALRQGIDLESPDAMFALFKNLNIAFDASGERLLLNGEDVSDDIRAPEVARNVKFAARLPAVRSAMAAAQRAMADQRPVVMEGRDIATVVLPGAKWKFFLTARPEVRAHRRHAEMLAAGREASYDTILEDIRRRDESDFQIGPMRKAMDLANNNGGIELVDTSDMTPDEAVHHILDRM